MNDVFSIGTLNAWLARAEAWVRGDVLVWANFVQIAGILVVFLVARRTAPAFARVVRKLKVRLGGFGWVERALAELEEHALPIVWLAIQWLTFALAAGTPLRGKVIEITVTLLAVWVVIQFAAAFIRDRDLRRAFAIFAWTVAALNVLGLLDPLLKVLDSVGVNLGGFHLTVMVVIKGLALFALLLWSALLASRALERRLAAAVHLSPSIRVLFGQLSRIVFVTLAVVVSLATVGVDLTAFAVFTGALGVGLGLGLQKVVSNLFSGVLLLMDRSIKPGDVIAVGQTYGWINFMGARYVSVITRDGIEHLLPNETLVTTPVENWSYSNDLLRLRIPIGISYRNDPHQAISLIAEACAETPRVLQEPKIAILLKGFGDSSVDLEARIWINDPRNGVSNVKSDVLLRVWDKFHAHGIEIPFPQRDLHIRSAEISPLVAPLAGDG